ncbi:hypothetical protein [Flavobacterium ginsengisoli]|uniref:hypothetical protein n=1 Tax=Flavobacterium ginsengisoli TaxID=871694 RepID=UPI002414DD6D|nr:hypothetical protein [Flavobacterium ginsengisoli]
METNQTEKLQKLQKLTAQYFTTLQPTNEANSYIAQFKVVNYLELGLPYYRFAEIMHSST